MTKLVLLIAAVGLLDATHLSAAEKKAPARKVEEKVSCCNTNQAGQTNRGETVTGSYLPQKVGRHGQIVDGPSSLIVLDQTSMRRTGAADVRQLLTRQGVH